MSLTRTEWIDMWHSLRQVEKYINERDVPRTEVFGHKNRAEVMSEIQSIKNKIQSVIGQME